MKVLGKVAFLVLTLTLTISTAEAKRRSNNEVYDPRTSNEGFRDKHNYPNDGQQQQVVDSSAGDADIVRAVNAQKRVNFVEGSGMVVIKVLPDDNEGLKHQKWIVRLSNGKQMQAVYNSDEDLCPRIPIKVGDVVAMGGMFLWTNQGGLLHWLHHDPRGNRPDGYVQLNGKFYCKD
ncbi:DUF3465 domain-containing protein [Bdellovibrio sp. NC01]|uniref:DUF3465 domain-containing protein n=1 Tax=Bdellovibrio sp. NC01 TaxID=2220073 RepID=UPI001157B954|nr:DUF3465 domain-containing protein [Bdellovibrio sp. NC01]QDK37045.1 hypothetical protein DOE51_05270 [Bdellovibrio sp. NC01]